MNKSHRRVIFPMGTKFNHLIYKIMKRYLVDFLSTGIKCFMNVEASSFAEAESLIKESYEGCAILCITLIAHQIDGHWFTFKEV